MNPVVRSLIAALATFAACWYVYWVPVAIAIEINHGRFRGMWIIRLIGSMAAAVIVAQYTWHHKSFAPQGPFSCVIVGAAVTGVVAFSAGWFGPMIFDPGSQGPLLGVVIGPLGFLLGAIGGAVYWAWWGKKKERVPAPTR